MVNKRFLQKIVIVTLVVTTFLSAELGKCSGISVSYNFEKIGSIDTNGETINVAIMSDIAFALDTADINPGGLVIINISDPTMPYKISSYYDGGNCYELAVRENYVFIADGSDGLKIFNVTDLEHPVKIYHYPVNSYCFDVELVGDLLYAGNGHYGLEIFNISDLKHPTKIARYDSNSLNCMQITIEDNLAIVTDHRNDYTSLVLLDITNPIAPEYITQYVKTDTDFWDPIIQNGYVYVGNHAINGGEMQILNVTEPSDISLVSIYDKGGSIFSIAFNNSIAFISNYNKGVEVVDVSDPTNPTKIGGFDDGGHTKKIAIKNDLVIVADIGDGLEILRAEISTKTVNGFTYLATISILTITSIIVIIRRWKRKRI
ncbi:MAG TPA: hypothetical protein VMZ29_10840 [Candidatus Bathyarchaeia archaeon]|nr:hypothetical protein [Candidatus Bathyarchaeia archaeon]